SNGALIRADVCLTRLRADVHVGTGHWRRQADLEAHARRDHAIRLERPKGLVRGPRRRRVARLELHAIRVHSRTEAEERHLAQQLAVPLAQSEERNRRIDFHGRVLLEHEALEEAPAATLTSLAVREAGEIQTERRGDRPEDRLGVGQRYAADEEHAAGAQLR